jgi:hypothetical protein
MQIDDAAGPTAGRLESMVRTVLAELSKAQRVGEELFLFLDAAD